MDTDFLSEGIHFDNDPEFVSDPASPDSEFKSIEVFYNPGKRPVIISHDIPQPSDDTAEAIEAIEESGHSTSSAKLIQRIRQTRQIIVIETDPIGASEEAWEMCECFESYVADVLDGIIYAPGEAIYDKKFRILKSLARE